MPPRASKPNEYRPSIFPGFQLTSEEEDDSNPAASPWKISMREVKLFVERNGDITLDYLMSMKIIDNAENDSISAQAVVSSAIVDRINDKSVLLLDDLDDLSVNFFNVSLQNACASVALTLQYSSVLRMILDRCLPKYLGGGGLYLGTGSRIARNLRDITKNDGDFWLPPVWTGAFYEEFMGMNCIRMSINRKIAQDNAVLHIMDYYLSSIRGVVFISKLLLFKIINSDGSIDGNGKDQYFVKQVREILMLDKMMLPVKSELENATEFCKLMGRHMQSP